MDILIRKNDLVDLVRHRDIRKAAMQKILSVRWQTDNFKPAPWKTTSCSEALKNSNGTRGAGLLVDHADLRVVEGDGLGVVCEEQWARQGGNTRNFEQAYRHGANAEFGRHRASGQIPVVAVKVHQGDAGWRGDLNSPHQSWICWIWIIDIGSHLKTAGPHPEDGSLQASHR